MKSMDEEKSDGCQLLNAPMDMSCIGDSKPTLFLALSHSLSLSLFPIPTYLPFFLAFPSKGSHSGKLDNIWRRNSKSISTSTKVKVLSKKNTPIMDLFFYFFLSHGSWIWKEVVLWSLVLDRLGEWEWITEKIKGEEMEKMGNSLVIRCFRLEMKQEIENWELRLETWEKGIYGLDLGSLEVPTTYYGPWHSRVELRSRWGEVKVWPRLSLCLCLNAYGRKGGRKGKKNYLYSSTLYSHSYSPFGTGWKNGIWNFIQEENKDIIDVGFLSLISPRAEAERHGEFDFNLESNKTGWGGGRGRIK